MRASIISDEEYIHGKSYPPIELTMPRSKVKFVRCIVSGVCGLTWNLGLEFSLAQLHEDLQELHKFGFIDQDEVNRCCNSPSVIGRNIDIEKIESAIIRTLYDKNGIRRVNRLDS